MSGAVLTVAPATNELTAAVNAPPVQTKKSATAKKTADTGARLVSG